MIINQNVKRIIKQSFYQYNNNPQLAASYEKVIDELVDYLASIEQIKSLDDVCHEIIAFLSQPRLRNLRDAMISEGKPLMNLGSILYSNLDGGAIVKTEKAISFIDPVTNKKIQDDLNSRAFVHTENGTSIVSGDTNRKIQSDLKKLEENMLNENYPQQKEEKKEVIVRTSDGRIVVLSPERAAELKVEIEILSQQYVEASNTIIGEINQNSNSSKK